MAERMGNTALVEAIASARAILETLEKEREYRKQCVTKKQDAPAPEPAAPVAPAPEDAFECPGQFWLAPPAPCVGKAKYAGQVLKIKANGKMVQVCKGCKLARDRENRKRKREEKDEQKE